MKKIVLLYAIAAFIACSCTGMQEAPEISGVPMVLTAYQEGASDTKTAVENGGKQVFWEPGDEIKVFSGSRSGRFTSNATGLTEVTEFTGRLEGDEPDVADIWAVYPYSDEASFDGETITTVIPSVQVARPGTFAQGANVAIAHSTTTNLQFYNVGGGIRFSLTEEGVKKVIFEGLGGEVISGTVKVGFEDGLPKVKEVSGGSIFITLTPPEGESFIPGQWYYMVAVPGTLESGFKLRFYKGNTTYARIVSENTYSIKRKLFGSMADVDNSLSYESTTTSFPASEDEWERSVEITEGIVYSANAIIIDEYDGEDIDELVHELEQIEWVIQAVPSPDGTTISINQSDGAWVDLSLVNPVVRTASKQTNDKQIIETSSSPIKKTVIEKEGGRALIMSPFQEQFQYPIEDWCQYLGAYFTVDTLLNSHAGIQDFVWRNHRGRELDDYDFILILTHGSIGSIDSIEDNTILSTSLCTGTVFN